MPNLLRSLLNLKQDDHAEITKQLYLKNLELARTNQTLALLRTIDLHVLDAKNTVKSLVELISTELMTTNNYTFLCIISRTEEFEKGYFVQSIAGANEALPGALQKKLKGHQANEKFINELKSFSEFEHLPEIKSKGLLQSNVDLKYLESELNKMRVKHLVFSKLESNNSVHGVLICGYDSSNKISESENVFLSRISEAFGVALDNKLLNSRLQKVALKLRLANARLKVIDETKDEFISMASHQLRTPLTTIKGCVSMVLEGDAGEIDPMQRKLLEQAFNSSQRMVYLIADFLNLSRLQTGKFELASTRINLPQLISEELEQLRASAQARGVSLLYEAPNNFPELMLDENKIRQVMMNFIDNAIYYARPDGGSISVILAKHAHHVSFKVIDNGIGVPKTERHQLFSKFYRASNAKKARPDGTGIGLFMAKKVIVAHGGSIVFESVEGQGSTFGFRLPLGDEAK